MGSLEWTEHFFTVIFSNPRESTRRPESSLSSIDLSGSCTLQVYFWSEIVCWLFIVFSFDHINANYPICTQRGEKILIYTLKSSLGKTLIFIIVGKKCKFSYRGKDCCWANYFKTGYLFSCALFHDVQYTELSHAKINYCPLITCWTLQWTLILLAEGNWKHSVESYVFSLFKAKTVNFTLIESNEIGKVL